MDQGLSPHVLGDAAPWTLLLPHAWRMAADPDGVVAPPPRPVGDASAYDRTAWWAPMLHLCVFGLGWSLPHVGLARWDRAGRATDASPVLRVVAEWWGPQLGDFLAWAGLVAPQGMLGIRTSLGLAPARVDAGFESYRLRLGAASWQETFRTTAESMRLTEHYQAPLAAPTADGSESPFVSAPPSDRSHDAPRTVLVQETYAGWYRRLLDEPTLTHKSPTGRRREVDVVVTPLGWLGRYHRSDVTGLWHRATHDVHLLGN